MASIDEARAALRARQGSGARYDAPEAPAETLAFARGGTAYFARILNGLSDRDLDGASLLPGVSRRRIVAQVGYQARALARSTQAAASGGSLPMAGSTAAWREEVEAGASLPARALRGLFRHAAVHLDVEWRDLSASAWDACLTLPDGSRGTTRETPWLRAREIWLRAVDMDAGGSFLDMPPGLVDRLLGEAAATWAGPPARLVPSDRGLPLSLGGASGPSIHGTAADLARWLTGRGARRLRHDEPLPALSAADPLLFQSLKED